MTTKMVHLIWTWGARFMAVILTLDAQADDILVPADYPTVQLGLYAAESGDRVALAAGTYSENVLLVPDVTLCAADGLDPTSVVVQAESGRVFEGGDFDGVVLRGFTVDGLGTASEGIWADSTGILLDDMIVMRCQTGVDYYNWPTFHVTNTLFQNNYDGAVFNGGLIEDCEFSLNSHDGLCIDSLRATTIRNCHVVSNGNYGVTVKRMVSSLTIGPGNSIFGNANSDVSNVYGSLVANAEGNWWGQAPPSTNQFTGNVDYIPYIGGSVTDNATLINVPGDFPTVQMGLYGAAAGGRVVLAAGTYSENILLVPDVTLCPTDGLDPTSVVVQAGSGRVFEGGDFDGVVLRGFTVDGLGTASEGIWVNSTGILLDDMIVTGCGKGLAENSWPTIHVTNSVFQANFDGVYLGSAFGTLVEDSIFYANSHDGMYFTEWSKATVRLCRIVGNAHDGVEVCWGATPTLGPGNWIYGNGNFDLENSTGSYVTKAENNWWGQVPPSTSQFSGNVDYVPYQGAVQIAITGFMQKSSGEFALTWTPKVAGAVVLSSPTLVAPDWQPLAHGVCGGSCNVAISPEQPTSVVRIAIE